jgi:hypothetical protein
MTGRGGPWRGALGGRSGDTGWLAVGSELRPTIRGGGPSSGDARGGCLGAARPVVAGAEVRSAAAVASDAGRQKRQRSYEWGKSNGLCPLVDARIG